MNPCPEILVMIVTTSEGSDEVVFKDGKVVAAPSWLKWITIEPVWTVSRFTEYAKKRGWKLSSRFTNGKNLNGSGT